MALDLPVVDGERSSGLHSRLILFHTMRKAFQFGQVTLVDEGSPGREPLPFPLAQHLEKVLRQAIRWRHRLDEPGEVPPDPLGGLISRFSGCRMKRYTAAVEV